MNSLNQSPRLIWHAGFVVERLEDAMAELTAGLGLHWAPIHQIKSALESPAGDRFPLDTRVVFSVDTPLSVELIEPTPGTPNVRRGDSAFHHLGYWSDDLETESDRLEGLGWPCTAFRIDPEQGRRRIQLNEGPCGVLLEACSALVPRDGLAAFYPEGVRP